MTWQEMDACFLCAAPMVTVDVYRRYIRWRLTVCDSRFMSAQYAVDRYKWAMSDPDWAEALMLARLGGKAVNDHDKEVYRRTRQAWHMASWDAKRRYDRWLTENMQISGDVADWHVAQLKWMESDPEWAEYVMLARLMG